MHTSSNEKTKTSQFYFYFSSSCLSIVSRTYKRKIRVVPRSRSSIAASTPPPPFTLPLNVCPRCTGAPHSPTPRGSSRRAWMPRNTVSGCLRCPPLLPPTPSPRDRVEGDETTGRNEKRSPRDGEAESTGRNVADFTSSRTDVSRGSLCTEGIKRVARSTFIYPTHIVIFSWSTRVFL